MPSPTVQDLSPARCQSRPAPSSSQSRPAAEASIGDPPRCAACLTVGLPEPELPTFTASVAGFLLAKALLQPGLKEVTPRRKEIRGRDVLCMRFWGGYLLDPERPCE